MPSTREMILSEDYADIIVPLFPCFLNQYREQGAQVFNDYYGGPLPHFLRKVFSTQRSLNSIHCWIPSIWMLQGLQKSRISRC